MGFNYYDTIMLRRDDTLKSPHLCQCFGKSRENQKVKPLNVLLTESTELADKFFISNAISPWWCDSQTRHRVNNCWRQNNSICFLRIRVPEGNAHPEYRDLKLLKSAHYTRRSTPCLLVWNITKNVKQHYENIEVVWPDFLAADGSRPHTKFFSTNI